MKYLKKFNESNEMESKIEDYLKTEFPTEWFDSELQERVYDYIDEEDAEDYGGDLVEAYKNLSTGGAVEYDLIALMTDEVCKEFGIKYTQKFGDRDVNDIVHDHLMDYCTWKDNFVFNTRSTEPYKNPFGFGDSFNDLMKKWDDGEIKL
jgi:hypothetical protein